MVKDTADSRKARAKAQVSSSIPKAVNSTSHLPPLAQGNASEYGSTSDKTERVRQAFLALGAPAISADEMRRLCKGPLADALLFMAEHLKGRAEVNLARQAIQQAREAGPSNRGSDGQQTEFIKVKHATARLNGANNDFKEAEAQLNIRLESILKSQREIDRLQVALDNKRKVLLLLQILERKETLRSSRFKEVDRLMDQHRADASKLIDEACIPAKATSEVKQKWPTMHIRAEYTQDVLAALQAYHIRLARSSASSGNHRHGAEAQRNASEARLRAALEGHCDEDIIEECQRVAQNRAVQNNRYKSPLPPSQPSDMIDGTLLDDMHARISEKEEKLQRLLHQIAHLESECTRSCQSLSAFDELTEPELLRSLQEEVRALEGYVDVFRGSIMQADAQVPHEHLMAEGKSWRQTLQDVRADIERTHSTDSFLRSTTLLDPSALHDLRQAAKVEESIATYQANQAQVNNRNSTLLARKLEKAKIGDELGRQIETLIAEKDIVAAMSGSSK
ncbi:uncharacterized protein C8Q71DRAFT_781882 [Rhodofomes roseus]|uniref:Uncharacterized protein n=1 Tax=Rhodofomes roseus TaxID=34475 RepID=A0ABQ8K439_9APHY|nr:uncharacterized protein C8Q71DRAFT_781882 [Rhodofomes roseus]KAH9831662.1 hypothetical protein C8Q71DRAFT_781882 [Rhodofomes roseus]